MDFRVKRSLLVGPTRPEDRMSEEKRILQEHFPRFVLDETPEQDHRAIVRGQLSTFANKSYKVRIVLPASYPHALPAVLPDDWKPRSNVHMLGTALCVMKASQWQAYMSAAFIVSKTALWLNKYEVFLHRGIWPGPEQHVHGTVYNVRKWWHDL